MRVRPRDPPLTCAVFISAATHASATGPNGLLGALRGGRPGWGHLLLRAALRASLEEGVARSQGPGNLFRVSGRRIAEAPGKHEGSRLTVADSLWESEQAPGVTIAWERGRPSHVTLLSCSAPELPPNAALPSTRSRSNQQLRATGSTPEARPEVPPHAAGNSPPRLSLAQSSGESMHEASPSG